MAFCYLRVVSRWLARVILPELILDRSGRDHISHKILGGRCEVLMIHSKPTRKGYVTTAVNTFAAAVIDRNIHVWKVNTNNGG